MDKQNLWKKVFKKFEIKLSIQTDHITLSFLKAVFPKFYLVASCIHCPKLRLHSEKKLNSYDRRSVTISPWRMLVTLKFLTGLCWNIQVLHQSNQNAKFNT